METVSRIFTGIGRIRPNRRMTCITSIADPIAIPLAIGNLKEGGVIALPTDTVYGLACCATDVDGVKKLYDIKARNEDKPVAICVGEENSIKDWARVEHLPDGLLKTLLPGPVTLVLTCKHRLDKSLNFDGKIGIRIPDFDFIRKICNGLGVPIALTSANLSGDPSSVSVNEFKPLWPLLSGVFDGGTLGIGDSNRGASTVCDLSQSGVFKIMRNGIAYEQTCKILKDHGLVDVTNKI